MSFQSLPKELKHQIVDACKSIDTRRQTRLQYTNKKRLRYELLGAVSLVNKELRAIAVKYVVRITLDMFSPLQLSKTRSTSLECTGATTQQVVDYLLYVVPRFAKIEEMCGLSQDHLDVLLGDSTLSGSESDAIELGKLREARLQFEGLASKIDEWTLFPKTEHLLKLANLGKQTIKYLNLFPNVPKADQSTYTFNLRDSQFHKVISLLPKLTHLTVIGLASSPSDLLDPIHADALAELYPFASTLFSLRISLFGYNHPKFTNFLAFCSRFPNFRILSLAVNLSLGLSHLFRTNVSPFSLPQLDMLLIESDGVDAYLMILSTILAPNVTSIVLATSYASCLAQTSPSSMTSLGKLLVEQHPSLRSLSIDTQDGVGLQRTRFDVLRQILNGAGVSVHCDWVYGSFESSLKKRWKYPFKLVSNGGEELSNTDSDESDEEEEAEEEQRLIEFEPTSTDDETLAAVTKGASEMGDWIKHQAETCRVTGDVEGGKKLMSLLEGVGNWKLHLED